MTDRLGLASAKVNPLTGRKYRWIATEFFEIRDTSSEVWMGGGLDEGEAGRRLPVRWPPGFGKGKAIRYPFHSALSPFPPKPEDSPTCQVSVHLTCQIVVALPSYVVSTASC